MDQVLLSADNTSVEIGTGLVSGEHTFRSRSPKLITGSEQAWADVYERLQSSRYNVVGGRVPGPGVGGLTLGGGYSWSVSLQAEVDRRSTAYLHSF